jgi:hypothetical protein
MSGKIPPEPSGEADTSSATEAGSATDAGSGAHVPEPLAPSLPEKGGRGGLDPTRYGDWEVGGICSDF